jgi:hypothetical protein
MVMYLTRHSAPCFANLGFIKFHWADIKTRERILVRQVSIAFSLKYTEPAGFVSYKYLVSFLVLAFIEHLTASLRLPFSMRLLMTWLPLIYPIWGLETMVCIPASEYDGMHPFQVNTKLCFSAGLCSYPLNIS